MSAWLLSIEGTETGHTVALILALTAAFLHAVFGALQKGKHDPWTSRASIDFCIFWFALPIALFVVPWPQGTEWWLFAGALVIHFIYKIGMAMAFERGAFTVVYPVVRGTGPLFTVIGAGIIFGEQFTLAQWGGVAVLLTGIFGLALYNYIFLVQDRASLTPALALAVFTGLMVAIYTTYDAYGIRTTPNPFTFLAWFFFITSIDFPLLWLWRVRTGRSTAPPLAPLLQRGAIGALVAFGSFGSIMMATRLDKVGEAAILRETSTVFAAFIGWIFLKETVGPRRIALMALIAAGAVIVEMAG
ncbi:MAG: EamA family transporter [Pseudomonadota bacterium]